MQCPKCNSRMEDGGAVCPKCNYNIYTGQYVQPVSAPPAPKKKSGGKVWKRLIVTVLACLIGREVGYAFGSRMAQRDIADRTYFRSGIVEQAEETMEKTQASPEFQAFLKAHGILSYDPNIKDKKVECFAIDQGNGVFEFMELGYSGDTVREVRDMIYIPLSGISSSQQDAFINSIKQEFAPHGSLSNCILTYDRSEYYFVVMLTYLDVHKSANIRAMTDLGIIGKDSATGRYASSVSLSKTTEDLLAGGAIQR